jgi:hypothetical protein
LAWVFGYLNVEDQFGGQREVFDILGQRVKVLVQEYSAGVSNGVFERTV